MLKTNVVLVLLVVLRTITTGARSCQLRKQRHKVLCSFPFSIVPLVNISFKTRYVSPHYDMLAVKSLIFSNFIWSLMYWACLLNILAAPLELCWRLREPRGAAWEHVRLQKSGVLRELRPTEGCLSCFLRNWMPSLKNSQKSKVFFSGCVMARKYPCCEKGRRLHPCIFAR